MSGSESFVITGVGVITCLGRGRGKILDAIEAGQVGLGPAPALEQAPDPEKGAGQAVDIDATDDTSRAARYLRAAVQDALRESDHTPRDDPRTAIVMGSTLHGMRAAGDALRSGDLSHLRDFLAGSVLDRAVQDLGIGPIRLTTCSACSSGLSSVGLGMTLLRAGLADAVIVGGYDTVSEYAYAGFDSLRLVSTKGVRPFAQDRAGMIVSEGYAALVLESEQHARARGANALATVSGFGESSDAFHLTQPDPEGKGATRAIRTALEQAAAEPAEVDLVTAHATGTPHNDAAEYRALRGALGDSLPTTHVVGLKGHTGHTLGGAGAVELSLALAARERSRVPPTPGADQTDPAFEGLRLVARQPIDTPINATLSLSLGFGGANTALITRPQGAPAPQNNPPAPTPADPVITGIGVVLPGAVGLDAFNALIAANQPIPSDPLDKADYEHLINARRARRISEYAKLSLAAATEACERASLTGELRATAAGLLGTTHGSMNYCEAYYAEIVKDGMAAANPVLFAEGVPNAAAAHLSMGLGIRGGCQTIIGSRTAGLEATALAAQRVREGRAQAYIVTVAEEHSEMTSEAHRQAAAAFEGPATAGAVALVIEPRAAAQARGINPLATLTHAAWADTSLDALLEQLGPTDTAWLDATLPNAHAAPHTITTAELCPELSSLTAMVALAASLAQLTGPAAICSTDYSGRRCGLTLTP